MLPQSSTAHRVLTMDLYMILDVAQQWTGPMLHSCYKLASSSGAPALCPSELVWYIKSCQFCTLVVLGSQCT